MKTSVSTIQSNNSLAKKVLWIILVVLAIIVGLYPAIYFFIDRKFGLLSTKPDKLLENTFWNIGFYTHIILGGLALLIGWTQFNTKFRDNNPRVHRRVGTVYVTAALISSIAAIGIGFFATGGIISSLGFICLGIIWFSSTLMAYIKIRNLEIDQHQKLMIFSYAACAAAITLRIWLPLLVVTIGDYNIAYPISAWLCWIPNIIVAYFIARRI